MRQEIRNTVTKLGMAVILLLAACALMPAQEVSTNAMPGVDFSKYHTYKWVTIEGATYPNQIVDAQIKQAVDSRLATKGLTKTDGDKRIFLSDIRRPSVRRSSGMPTGRVASAGVVGWPLLNSLPSPQAHWFSTCTIPLPNNSFGLAARARR